MGSETDASSSGPITEFLSNAQDILARFQWNAGIVAQRKRDSRDGHATLGRNIGHSYPLFGHGLAILVKNDSNVY
jgi:hypothetical protein